MGAFEQKAAFDNCPNNSTDYSFDKATIRREIIIKRNSISPDAKKIKDQAIHDRLQSLDEFNDAKTLLVYASFRSEVDTENIIRNALAKHRNIVLPRVEKYSETLRLFKIAAWSDLEPGCWGIPEPQMIPSGEMKVENIDLVVVPGVAFDQDCNRIGYGKGYYDKLLSSRKTNVHPLIIGLAYEEQIVRSIPFKPHDMKMDLIITDKRIIHCHGSQKN